MGPGWEKYLQQRRGHESRDHHHQGDGAEETLVEDFGGESDLGENKPDFASGNHGYADHVLLSAKPKRRIPRREFANHGHNDEQTADQQGLAMDGIEGIQDPKVDLSADEDKKERYKETHQTADALLDLMDLGRARQQQAGGEGADDHG